MRYLNVYIRRNLEPTAEPQSEGYTVRFGY